jgi:hypothetical protein
MAFSASFYWDYNTQLAGLLGSTWPNHFSKCTCSLCKSIKLLCYGACLVHAIELILLPVEKFWQAQRHLTRHNCLYLVWSTTQNIQATIVIPCCCLIYGSCRFPWNPNDWFLIGRDHVVWCMPQCNHMPCVYFSCVVDFALGVLTWAMSHIYDQGA